MGYGGRASGGRAALPGEGTESRDPCKVLLVRSSTGQRRGMCMIFFGPGA